VPDFIGVMLDPAGLRKNLAEFLLGDATYLPGMIEQDGAGTGGPLVESENVLVHLAWFYSTR
jgi:hypothetical protein